MQKPEEVRFYLERAAGLALARQELLDTRELKREMLRVNEYPWHHPFDHAVGLLSVHAAIAFADALLIAETGKRAGGDNHMNAHKELADHCSAAGIEAGGLKHLQTLIGKKTKFSYTSERYGDSELLSASLTLDQFMKWIFGSFTHLDALYQDLNEAHR